MNAGAVGPREPEEANRNQDGSENGGWQTGFGRRVAIGSLGSSPQISLVVEHGSDSRQSHTNGNADKCQTTNARAPATTFLVDNGESSEAHVESTVDDGHVQGDEKDDGLPDEKLPRSQQGNLELIANALDWLSRLESRNVDLASFLAQGNGALAEQNRGICLGVYDRAENPNNTSEDGDESLNPSPALGLTKEATCNGTQSRAQEWSHGKDAESNSSLIGLEHIGNDTTGIRQRRRAESAGKESEDNEGSNVLRTSGSGTESGQGHVTDEKGFLAAVQLRQRGPKERTNGKAHDKQRYTQNGDFGGDVKLHDNLTYTARISRTSKGDGKSCASLDESDGPFE